MADNLLNKNKEKRNLLERKEEVKPQQSFNRSSLFTVNESEHTNEDKKKDTSRKKTKSKTCTALSRKGTSENVMFEVRPVLEESKCHLKKY